MLWDAIEQTTTLALFPSVLMRILSCICVYFRAPPVTLLPEARYEQVMCAFGGSGYLVRTVEELCTALQQSLNETATPSLINVLIDPSSDRKQQVAIYTPLASG